MCSPMWLAAPPTCQVDLTTNLTKNIKLRIPIVSSPMDTVTEGEMAITMAMVRAVGKRKERCTRGQF